jgi:hypothetical protein
MKLGLPNKQPKTGSTKKHKTTEERDLQFLGFNQDSRNKTRHPDGQPYEVVCLQVRARGEIVFHVGEACLFQ